MKTIFHRCISVLLALLLALGVLGPGQVQAAPNPLAICVWTGASLNHGWSVDANWVNCSGLSNGMTAVLVFPAGVPNKDSQNDLANLNIVSIGLEVSGYTLSGNQIVLT